jgi:thymidylate synthase (FAD)
MIQVLDHGYVEYVTHWGSDEDIIRAARMSTNKGFQGWGGTICPHCQYSNTEVPEDSTCWGPDNKHEWQTTVGDEKLLRYLYEHKHMTPFEMAGLTIEVQAPIMVFREWHR